MDRINTKRYKRVLMAMIITASGALLLVFTMYRHPMNNATDPVFSFPGEASIALDSVHHIATRNGMMEWQLDAASVVYNNTKNQAVFNAPTIIFFLNNEEKITLIARQGELNTNSNNIKVADDVVMNHAQYELRTSALYYEHKTRKLYTKAPVELSGDSFRIRADTMVFDLNTNQTIFEGNIQGALHESI